MVIVAVDKSSFEQILSEFIDSCIKEDHEKVKNLIDSKTVVNNFSELRNFCAENILQSTKTPEELGLAFRSNVGNAAVFVMSELFEKMVKEFEPIALTLFEGKFMVL